MGLCGVRGFGNLGGQQPPLKSKEESESENVHITRESMRSVHVRDCLVVRLGVNNLPWVRGSLEHESSRRLHRKTPRKE